MGYDTEYLPHQVYAPGNPDLFGKQAVHGYGFGEGPVPAEPKKDPRRHEPQNMAPVARA